PRRQRALLPAVRDCSEPTSSISTTSRPTSKPSGSRMRCSKTFVSGCGARGKTHTERNGSKLMRTTLDRLFVAHPRAVNEDYFAHFGVALRFALLLSRVLPGVEDRRAAKR